MIETRDKTYTVAEYLELEKTSDIRHEFAHGKLIPISGESKNANKIAFNCAKLLDYLLSDKGLEAFMHDVRTMVKENSVYRYPDLVVAPESDDTDTHTVTQPVILIEVLSETTANEDRGAKLREYTALPSLQYYMILAQDQILAECYSRRDNGWFLEFFDESSEEIALSACNVQLPLELIYRKVSW